MSKSCDLCFENSPIRRSTQGPGGEPFHHIWWSDLRSGGQIVTLRGSQNRFCQESPKPVGNEVRNRGSDLLRSGGVSKVDKFGVFVSLKSGVFSQNLMILGGVICLLCLCFLTLRGDPTLSLVPIDRFGPNPRSQILNKKGGYTLYRGGGPRSQLFGGPEVRNRRLLLKSPYQGSKRGQFEVNSRSNRGPTPPK